MLENILVILGATVLYGSIIFFNDESCLPYKRKMEKMIREIKFYQTIKESTEVEFTYRGRTFKVHVHYCEVSCHYGYYEVQINGNVVKKFHILKHICFKSRYEEHCGKMRESEENDIIKAAYKYVKKANHEHFNKEWKTSSYFD